MVSNNCCLSSNITPMERFRRIRDREEMDERTFSVKYIGSTAVSHPGTDELCRAINEVYSQNKHKLSQITAMGLTLTPAALYLAELGEKGGHMSFVIKRVVYCGVDRMRQKIFAFMYKSSEVVYGVLDCQVIYCKSKNDAKTLALTLSNYFHGPKTSIKTGIPPPSKRFNSKERRKDLEYKVFPLQSRANDLFDNAENSKGRKNKMAEDLQLQVNLDRQEMRDKENIDRSNVPYLDNRYTTVRPQKDQCSPEDSVVEDDALLNYEAEDEDEEDDDEEDETSDDREHVRRKRDWILNVCDEDQQCDTSTSTSSYAELKSCSKCGSVTSLSKLNNTGLKTSQEDLVKECTTLDIAETIDNASDDDNIAAKLVRETIL